MTEPPRPSSHANTLLIAGVVLVAVVLVGVFTIRVADCPTCQWDFFGPFEKWDVHKLESVNRPCESCGGKTRVSLFKRWGLDRAK